ncbi:hypothetical protein C0989_000517 [Termitomyces sp. Mn162]|nr:hypothetical protein C0989_000517 [Termitomyces sp. Mn162]
MSIEPYNTYILVNVKSGTALDLSGTDGYTGVFNIAIEMFCQQTDTRLQCPVGSGMEEKTRGQVHWTLEKFEDTNQWTFRNVYSGKYLGLAELSELRDDIPIQGVDYPVPWDIFEDELDRSTYRIVVPETSFNVDLSNFGDPNNGTLVAIWGQWEALNQTWRFEQVHTFRFIRDLTPTFGSDVAMGAQRETRCGLLRSIGHQVKPGISVLHDEGPAVYQYFHFFFFTQIPFSRSTAQELHGSSEPE